MSLKGALTHHRKGGAVRSPREEQENCPQRESSYRTEITLNRQQIIC